MLNKTPKWIQIIAFNKQILVFTNSYHLLNQIQLIVTRIIAIFRSFTT